MVKIQRSKANSRFPRFAVFLCILLSILTVGLLLLSNAVTILHSSPEDEGKGEQHSHVDVPSKIQPSTSHVQSHPHSCEYHSLSDLKDYELHPNVSEQPDGNNRRHAYDPPEDGVITLVCCDTTAGSLSIAVHDNWAPLGAERFLDMVQSNYFSSKVALMRCVRNFICQFGIAGNPSLNNKYKSFADDKQWLKEGPNYRKNDFGAFRFPRGYFAYAGGGKNSRSNQLIVSLGDNQRLGGGSPWEVPFGEVVGVQSYETLAKISTIYGEKGPSQGMLFKEGSSAHIAELFPKLDYVTKCAVVDKVDMNKAR